MTADSTTWSLILIFLLACVGFVVFYWQRRERWRQKPGEQLYLRALEAMVEEKWREAVRLFQEVIRHDTTHAPSYIRLGQILRRLGRLQKAAAIHKDLTYRSDLPASYRIQAAHELALDLEGLGEIDQALKVLGSHLKDNPVNPDFYPTYIRLLEKTGKWREAGEFYQRYLEANHRSDATMLALYKLQEGESLCEAGDEHSGRVAFKEALKIDPSAREAMLHIAASYIRDNRGEEALEWLNRFLSEEPEKAHLALFLIEQLLFQLGRFSKIEEMLRSAMEKAPHNLALHLAYVELKIKKGEYPEALEWCERCLEQFPDHHTVKLLYLQLLLRMGEHSRALPHLDRMVDTALTRTLSLYCHQCGYQSERLFPRCPQCGSWRSFFSDRRH